MELIDLCGQHIFSGIEPFTVKTGWCANSNGVRFVFDGVTYEAVEDPADGYRSFLGRINESDVMPNNTFPGVLVVCHMEQSHYNEILCAVDAHNGKIVLRIGTDYSDGFYPRCILEYNPENMHLNEMRGGTHEIH